MKPRMTDVVLPPTFEQTASFTPGKWHVADEHPDGVLDRLVMAGGYYVATVHDTASHDGCWDADARLIAAAPALLAALEQSEIAVAELCQDQSPANQCWLILAQVRAAIVKAKGGAL